MTLNFFSPSPRTNYRILRRHPPFLETIDQKSDLNFVLLHGWHSLYDPMVYLENALRQLPGGNKVRFWRVTYDTHWRPFTQTSREIIRALRQRKVQPENAILLGFSMGGIVARGMIANGFEAHHVFCLCSPHYGPGRWMPSGDIGSTSIAPWSRRLLRLNSNPRDTMRRRDYSFYGISFDDTLGHHSHDRVVPLHSALGTGLENVGFRHEIKLRYRGIASGCDPHVQGMLPANHPVLLEECRSLFSKLG